MAKISAALLFVVFLSAPAIAQEAHEHGIPEKLGTVSFQTSCNPAVQLQFERAVALLHSFAYSAAETAFRQVAESDPTCAIAHWGIAITYFHQLWDPPIAAASMATGRQEIERAQQIGGGSARERGFIQALSLMYAADPKLTYHGRLQSYTEAMQKLAAANPGDVECQIFYALALLASAPPTDKTHAYQKHAVAVLQPLYEQHPQHPGLAHYLIHACDNAEMAREGLPAAQAYAKIAPSAPHALHMPSHIFTRLGMWDDSIQSNLAAQSAAKQQGEIGEELHAMDYLVYAYLQNGENAQAFGVIEQLKSMPELQSGDFKVGYAATAMPVRYAVERQQWAEAASIAPPPSTAPPHVIAIAVWARGLGLARTGHAADARAQAATLQQLEDQLHKLGRDYWAGQVDIQRLEVLAWAAQAEGKSDDALALLRQAADTEDAIEKLPVTPGPIIPAREQLGDLLLQMNQPHVALKEFQIALVNAPGRRGANTGAARALQLSTVADSTSSAR
jgi:tetratricopeptide (TPR) repeat protein